MALSPRPLEGSEPGRLFDALRRAAADGRASFGVASTIERSFSYEEETEKDMIVLMRSVANGRNKVRSK